MHVVYSSQTEFSMKAIVLRVEITQPVKHGHTPTSRHICAHWCGNSTPEHSYIFRFNLPPRTTSYTPSTLGSSISSVVCTVYLPQIRPIIPRYSQTRAFIVLSSAGHPKRSTRDVSVSLKTFRRPAQPRDQISRVFALL